MISLPGYLIALYRKLRHYRENVQIKKHLSSLHCDVPPKNKRILIGIMNYVGTKLSAEIAYIRYFYKKGYTVDVFTCNGECACCVPRCSPKLRSTYCQACICRQNEIRNLLKGKVNFLKISDFVNADEIKEIKKVVAARDFSKNDDFVWQGIDLHDSIWYGIMRTDLKSYVNLEQDIEKIKLFAVSSFSLATALAKYFTEHSQALLGSIVSHGMYHLYGPLLDVANHFNVKGAYWNEAYMRPHTVYFGLNKHIFTAGIFEKKENWAHIHLNEEQKQHIKDKIKWNCPPMPQEFMDKIKQYKKVFGMYTNIPWDGAVSNATEGFPNTNLYITYTLDWFRRNPDCLLVMRAHPCESLPYARKAEKMSDIVSQFELPPNVIFIPPSDPVKSYMIADIADASILYGGTMGLELTVAGKIAIQTGHFYWTGKGFLFECDDKQSFYDYLDQVKNGTLKLTDEMYENALTYAWHFVYERHLDMDYILPDGKGRRLHMEDEELMKSETLALIENCLEKGADIFKKSC